MARNGDKLHETPSFKFIVCVGTLQRLGRSQNVYDTQTLDVPCTSCKNFVNFSAVNHSDVVVNLQKEWVDAHIAKIRTFALFSPEFLD